MREGLELARLRRQVSARVLGRVEVARSCHLTAGEKTVAALYRERLCSEPGARFPRTAVSPVEVTRSLLQGEPENGNLYLSPGCSRWVQFDRKTRKNGAEAAGKPKTVLLITRFWYRVFRFPVLFSMA